MTLTSRVSYFFLIALAVILTGYSIVLYGLARYYLYREFDYQLRSTLNTLVAAIEVESDDVKWEPSDHTVTIGSERDTDDPRWVVVDETAQIVDRSSNLTGTADDEIVLNHARLIGSSGTTTPSPREWRFLQSRLAAPMPKPPAERDIREHAVLVVTVARSVTPVERTLNGLAILTGLLTLGVWTIAAIGGRRLCSKALEPVGRMAASARTIGPANPQKRLPVSPSQDELSDLGHAFNDLLDQLFQAFQRQQRLAGDAAHQLRTPLTVLQGQIEVALRKPRAAAEYAETLSVLNSQVAELRQIVESLLFLARSEDEAQSPPMAQVELSAWLKNYILRWQSHTRFSDMRLEADQVVSCETSEALLSQLLDNLIGNALKYSVAGSPVTVSLARQDRSVTIEVADRGIGIAPEDVTLVFEPFFRSENARRSGTAGTGLGLALAARIARALHARLTCASQLGQGTRFTLQCRGE